MFVGSDALAILEASPLGSTTIGYSIVVPAILIVSLVSLGVRSFGVISKYSGLVSYSKVCEAGVEPAG